MIGELGYLKDLGLIPLPKDRRTRVRERVMARTPLKLSDIR